MQRVAQNTKCSSLMSFRLTEKSSVRDRSHVPPTSHQDRGGQSKASDYSRMFLLIDFVFSHDRYANLAIRHQDQDTQSSPEDVSKAKEAIAAAEGAIREDS